MPASPERRSRPAEQADGKSRFLPQINKVGTGRAALGAAREGKGVGSLLHGPLPAQPPLLPRELPPPAGAGRATVRGEARGAGGGRRGSSVRRRDGAAGGKRAPRAVPGAGPARAGRRHGSGAEFLPGVLGPAGAPAPRATRQLPPTRALAGTHAESHGHAAPRAPCHAHAPCGTHAASPRARRVTRTSIPTHARCLSHGGMTLPRGSTAALTHPPLPSPGTHAATRSHSPTRALPHSDTAHTLTLTRPRDRTRSVSHAGTPGAPRASSRRRSPPQTSTRGAARRPRLLPGHTATRPRTPAHRASAAHARGGPAGATPAPCPGGRPCALAGNPRTFPAAPLAALRRHRRASCAAPLREQLVFVPTRRPGGGGGGKGRPGQGGATAGRGARGARGGGGSTCRRASPPRGHPRPGGTPATHPPSLPRCIPLPPPMSSLPPPRAAAAGWPRRRQRRALGGRDARAARASRGKANSARGAGRGSG